MDKDAEDLELARRWADDDGVRHSLDDVVRELGIDEDSHPTLTEFLTARYDEIEASARETVDDADSETVANAFYGDLNENWIYWREVRTLRECQANRRIVEWHKPLKSPAGFSPNCEGCWEDGGEDGAPLWPCRNVRWLAEVFADHPDYREEWKP